MWIFLIFLNIFILWIIGTSRLFSVLYEILKFLFEFSQSVLIGPLILVDEFPVFPDFFVLDFLLNHFLQLASGDIDSCLFSGRLSKGLFGNCWFFSNQRLFGSGGRSHWLFSWRYFLLKFLFYKKIDYCQKKLQR